MPSNQIDPPLPQQVRRPFCFTIPTLLSSKQLMDTSCQTFDSTAYSLGCFCDAECTATFTKSDAIIFYKEQVVLWGIRHSHDLWYLDIQTFNAQNQHHQQQSLNAITSVHTTKCLQHALQFMHATLFSPTKATLLTAIRAGFLSS